MADWRRQRLDRSTRGKDQELSTSITPRIESRIGGHLRPSAERPAFPIAQWR
jgi:hypothetical protein